MATGRTVQKWLRIYAGHEGIAYPSLLCGLTRSVGPLVNEFTEIDASGICDAVKGYLPGQPSISPGALNVIMDPTAPANSTAFMYPSLTNGFVIGQPLITQIAFGIRAEPILGDPVFGGIFPFNGATFADDGGLVTMNFDLGASEAYTSPITTCGRAWGQLLHPFGEESGANSSGGADCGVVAGSANGGLMLLNVFLSDGNAATLKIEHSANNSTWSDLTGATVTFSGAVCYSYYALVAPGTTVNRYLRWQSTTDTNTFVMSFIRG